MNQFQEKCLTPLFREIIKFLKNTEAKQARVKAYGRKVSSLQCQIPKTLHKSPMII